VSQCASTGRLADGRVTLRINGTTMSQFATYVSGRLSEVVVNRTGLEGLFDLTMSYSPDPSEAQRDFSTLFDILNRQLGVKLERRREPIEVLVIDKLEPPKAD
jgi:uncharacterized protein (TIGR03435 family)